MSSPGTREARIEFAGERGRKMDGLRLGAARLKRPWGLWRSRPDSGRRSGDWATEGTDHPREVVEATLAHVVSLSAREQPREVDRKPPSGRFVVTLLACIATAVALFRCGRSEGWDESRRHATRIGGRSLVTVRACRR